MRRVVEIALFTERPDELIAFYEQLLTALPTHRWENGATFDLGGLTLLIHETEHEETRDTANRDHVAIGVEDVDGAAGHLREQGFDIDGPRNYYWGRSTYRQDPDGRMLELHQPE